MPRSSDRNERVFSLIGQRIRALRENARLSQDELAKQVRLKRTSIVLIESGNQRLPIDRLYSIAQALNTTPQRLLPDIDEVFPESAAADPSVVVHGGPEDNHVTTRVLDVLDTVKKQPDGGNHT